MKLKPKKEKGISNVKSKLCIECGARDTYEFKNAKGNGYHFEMLVNIPFYKICGAPIYDEEFEEEIAEKANKKIREQRKQLQKSR